MLEVVGTMLRHHTPLVGSLASRGFMYSNGLMFTNGAAEPSLGRNSKLTIGHSISCDELISIQPKEKLLLRYAEESQIPRHLCPLCLQRDIIIRTKDYTEKSKKTVSNRVIDRAIAVSDTL